MEGRGGGEAQGVADKKKHKKTTSLSHCVLSNILGDQTRNTTAILSSEIEFTHVIGA
jgi:hypothetical protein